LSLDLDLAQRSRGILVPLVLAELVDEIGLPVLVFFLYRLLGARQ